MNRSLRKYDKIQIKNGGIRVSLIKRGKIVVAATAADILFLTLTFFFMLSFNFNDDSLLFRNYPRLFDRIETHMNYECIYFQLMND